MAVAVSNKSSHEQGHVEIPASLCFTFVPFTDFLYSPILLYTAVILSFAPHRFSSLRFFTVFPLSSSFCSLTLAKSVYYDPMSFTFCSPVEDVCTYVRTYTYKWMYTYVETAVHRSHVGECTELASHIFEGRYRHSVATFRWFFVSRPVPGVISFRVTLLIRLHTSR